jgi:hypothetical protein
MRARARPSRSFFQPAGEDLRLANFDHGFHVSERIQKVKCIDWTRLVDSRLLASSCNSGRVCRPIDHAWRFCYRCRGWQWKPPQAFCQKLSQAGCDGRIKSGGLANARYAATLSLSPSARITFSTVANSGFARAKAPCKDSPDLGLAIPHRRRGDRSIAAAFAGACCTGVLPKGVRCAVLRLPRSGK